MNGCLDGRVVARMHLACLLLAVALLSAFRTIRTAHRRLSGTGYAALLQYTALLGIIFLVPGIAFAHAPGASVMGPAPFENPAKGRIPDPFLYLSPQNPGQVLLVEKASQKAYLYRNTDLVHAFRTYPCSTGERSGPKTARNDKRTPEGIYYVTNSFKEQELASIYGVRAFPIDYPNPLDRELRRMGYGIWIHGTNEPLKPWDTNGCVVFRNEDILDLSRYIHEGQTPIIITQKINFVEEEMLQREGAELKRLVIEWIESWRESRVERYMSFYGQDFVSQGKDWHQWRAHKKRLTEKYGRIDIKIDGLQILRENGVVLARFIQTYRADGFFSNGVKRLYLMKKSPEWKITYEFFTKKTDQEYSSDRHDDYGRKTLQIVKKDERWRIKSETWVPLKGRNAR